MQSEVDSNPTSILEVLTCIESLLLQTWQETGFGALTIESERIADQKIRVIVKGGTYYEYVIVDEQVKVALRRDRASTSVTIKVGNNSKG